MTKLVAFLSFCLLAISTNSFAYTITSPTDSSLVGGDVIDFSAQTVGRYTSLSIGDVTFTANDNDLSIASNYSGSYNTTGLYLDNGDYSTNGFSSITFSFASDVNAFGFNFGASNYSWTLTAYDGSGSIIESMVISALIDSNNGEFFGIAANGIAYAVLSNNDPSYDWIFIDNFTTSAVPVPAAVWLFGSGLLGLIGFTKRKAANS
jgi:hypothetical protein